MKKKIVAVVSIVVAVCIIAAAIAAWLYGRNAQKQQSYSIEEFATIELLQAVNQQEIDLAAEKARYEIEKSGKYNVVTINSFSETEFQAIFELNEETVGKLTGSFVLKTPISEIKDTAEVYYYTNKMIDVWNKLFDYQITGDDHIYAANGSPLSVDDIESYAKLIDGQASFWLSVRDSQQTLWIIESTVYNDRLIFNYTRHFDTELYKDLVADLVIE